MAGLVDRVKNILLTPKTEWPVIDAESGDTKEVFTYVAVLAAFPFVGNLLQGIFQTGIATGLTKAIVVFAVTFLAVYVLAYIVDALAPTFNGEKHMPSALKLVAYGATPGWLAGLFVFLPYLGGLIALLGGIYGIYLLYLGLPVLMRAPQDKVIGYLLVAIICAIVLFLVLFFIIGLIIGILAFAG